MNIEIKTIPPPEPVVYNERVYIDMSLAEAEMLYVLCGAIGGRGPVRDVTSAIYMSLTERFFLTSKAARRDRRSRTLGDTTLNLTYPGE